MFFSYFGIRRKARKFLSTTIGEVMSKTVVTLKKSESVIQAATKMIAQGVSSVVVVDEGRVRGLVTERDFINKVPLNSSSLNKKVLDVMSKSVVTVSSPDSLEKVFLLFKKHGFRKIIVLDDNRLAGIVTQRDLLECFANTFQKAGSSKPLVSDWMTQKIVFVSSNASFSEAKSLMKKKDVGAVFVKKKDSFVGLFTEHDIVAQLYDQGGILKIGKPEEFMTAYLRCVDASSSVFFANKLMLEKNIRRLGVVKDDKVVGVITQTDVAQGICLALQEMAKQDVLLKKVPKEFDERFITNSLKVYS